MMPKFDSKYRPVLIKEHQPWILYLVILVHLTWAISIHQNPLVAQLFILIGLDYMVQIGIAGNDLSIVLFAVSSSALIALVFERVLGRWRSLLLMVPQYLLLVLSFMSDARVFATQRIHCTVGANCVNGNQHVDIWIVVAVLCIFMYGALLHTAAVLERFVFRWYQPADFGIQEFDDSVLTGD